MSESWTSEVYGCYVAMWLVMDYSPCAEAIQYGVPAPMILRVRWWGNRP